MNKKILVEVLDLHAQALIDDVDLAPELVAQYPQDSDELGSLFQIANSLKESLVPIPASEFKIRLNQRLRDYPQGKLGISATLSHPRMIWLVLAAAGSMLSITGIVLIVFRRLKPSGTGQPRTATTSV